MQPRMRQRHRSPLLLAPPPGLMEAVVAVAGILGSLAEVEDGHTERHKELGRADLEHLLEFAIVADDVREEHV